MNRIGRFLKEHPKLTGLVATGAVAAGAYYGVPPEYTNQALQVLARLVGM